MPLLLQRINVLHAGEVPAYGPPAAAHFVGCWHLGDTRALPGMSVLRCKADLGVRQSDVRIGKRKQAHACVQVPAKTPCATRPATPLRMSCRPNAT